MTNWRIRMHEERLQALLQESMAIATRSGAMKPGDLARVIVDTTVQPKNITFPTDAKLLNRAREKPVKLAKKLGVELRQSHTRLGKFELPCQAVQARQQGFAHAQDLSRARYPGHCPQDRRRSPARNQIRLAAKPRPTVRERERGPSRPKVYSLHAPEVESMGKGNRTNLTSSASRRALPPPSNIARAPVRRPHAGTAWQSR
jgi:transposase, IS5 family